MVARIGAVSEKIMQLLSKHKGPISLEEVHYQLGEPIGLIHLGVDRLVREGEIEVITEGFRNYLKPLSDRFALKEHEELVFV